jgi:hypothetical protein
MVIRAAFLDRWIVLDTQTRAVVEEDALAAPEGVGLDGRAGDVVGAVHRVGGAVAGLRRRAGGVFLQVVDDTVVSVPGLGVVGLCRGRVAVVDVDLGVSDRGETRDFHVELKLAAHGIIGDELPLQPGGLVAGRNNDVGAVGAGVRTGSPGRPRG